MTRLSARTHNRGFTLLELIVVLAILTVTAAICLPQFYSMFSRTQDSTLTGRFANTFQKAHHRAIFQRQTVEVVLDLTEQEFYIRKVKPERYVYRFDEREDLFKMPQGYTIEEIEFIQSAKRHTRSEVVLPFHADGTTLEANLRVKRQQDRDERPAYIHFRLRPATSQLVWRESRDDFIANF